MLNLSLLFFLLHSSHLALNMPPTNCTLCKKPFPEDDIGGILNETRANEINGMTQEEYRKLFGIGKKERDSNNEVHRYKANSRACKKCLSEVAVQNGRPSMPFFYSSAFNT